MYRDLAVAVVIPAFNERRAIADTVATVPSFVDRVIVVDDASTDGTAVHAGAAARRRSHPAAVEVNRHPANRGVGGAIATGYRRALALGVDVTAVMAGD